MWPVVLLLLVPGEWPWGPAWSPVEVEVRRDMGMELPEGSATPQVPLFTSGFVRLVGGDNRCSGRVEINDRDGWKSVCDSHFGAKAADVVCRDLQCGRALPVTRASPSAEGTGPIWDRELQCVGNESTLSSCPTRTPQDQPCTQTSTAAVSCTRKGSGKAVGY